MSNVSADTIGRAAWTSLGLGIDWSALGALFVLTLRQQLRGRRVLILSLLFALPSILVGLTRLAAHPPAPRALETALVFYFIPHALVTLTALLYAAGIVQDEVEEQTLTYLLARPLPRWALYATRLAATLLVTAMLTSAFTLLTMVVIDWNTPELSTQSWLARALRIVALLALAQVSYCSLFGLLGMFARRSLLVGLAYIVVFEGLLANLDFVARRLTTMYYFRVLALRWLDLPQGKGWSIDLATAPTSQGCVLTLLGASLAFLLLATLLMMCREFRMKTPEGS